jgi:hypothetical protein
VRRVGDEEMWFNVAHFWCEPFLAHSATHVSDEVGLYGTIA